MRSLAPVVVAMLCAIAWSSGCSKKEESAQSAAGDEPAAGQAQADDENLGENVLKGPGDYLYVTTVRAPRHAKQTLAIAELTQQIQQFNALKGRYPESLEELAKWRGAELPPVPSGSRYDYDQETGTLKVVPEK
jgi:hypothetical protein